MADAVQLFHIVTTVDHPAAPRSEKLGHRPDAALAAVERALPKQRRQCDFRVTFRDRAQPLEA